ncbi:MAG: glycoside hydrolase family 88 protein [Lacibacter sp.]
MQKQLLLLGTILLISYSIPAQKLNVQKIISEAAAQTKLLLNNVTEEHQNNPRLVSPRTVEKGKLKLVSSKDWTSGFFAGELWMLYKFSNDTSWKNKAETFTQLLAQEQFNADSHDVGFKMYNSYGRAYAVTKNELYKKVIIQSAKTLATRFDSTVGCIRSWDFNKDRWTYPVIIDNMMNLELLFAATRLSGDSSFYRIAVSHANATMKNHFRDDYSSYHVVDYDTADGHVRSRVTHQGYANESAWARGQAWGLYGFTMCYRETKEKRYLLQAEHIFAFISKHPNLPDDGIPYWDFNAPGIPKAPKDASAAAVMASALYEMARYSKNAKQYQLAADQIITQLTLHYRSQPGQNFGFILEHSTGHLPGNSEIDVPINYADYYFIEALLRRQSLFLF